MIYLTLFWEFLKIGMFSFGGAYGAIPLIGQAVLSQGWMDESMFQNILAISESTPGPIMVNAATYIGSTQAGILGAAAATLGVVLPSFIIILLISTLFRVVMKHRSVQAILRVVKPCIIGVILSTGIYMGCTLLFGMPATFAFDWRALLILSVLLAISWLYPKFRKREFSPIFLIVLAAIFGILIY